jgi:hypothetical protein
LARVTAKKDSAILNEDGQGIGARWVRAFAALSELILDVSRTFRPTDSWKLGGQAVVRGVAGTWTDHAAVG